MRIKNLTIHGFKSFVDKVSINLSPGASGIIGPNGCGKSNIVDAIRWVIGEQNPRHLRGKQMEDVIFNGSDIRKPMGMAEVVLTFANDEGKAPGRFAGFTEIEVSRRLYRSGESEYYLNKVQCRLRDIVELFTDTGIGTRAYSIVEQGQVGWLINAKPEERRILFEEAAGIAKYRHKKEAALRKLEATKGNLTRVSDIISEVKRQLNSLDRQARKAEKYKALREELKAVELKLASVEAARVTEGHAALLKRLDSIRDEETSNHAATATREAAAEELKLEHAREESSAVEVRQALHGVEKEIQAEERSSALLLMRADELERSETRLLAEIEELSARSAALGQALDGARNSLAETAAALEGSSVRFAEAAALVDGVDVRLREKEEAERGIKAAIVSLVARASDLRHAIQNCQREEETLRQREASASTQRREAAEKLSSIEAPASELKGRVAEKAASREALASTLTELRAKLDETTASAAAVEAELKGLEEERAGSLARLNALEAMQRNLENVAGGPRSIIQKGSAGVRGLMADVIEANPGYERAVEAVLGDRLQYVIVESQKEGIEAVEYLKSGALGRASFLPVREARPAPSLVASDVPASAFGNAKELLSEVRIKDGFERIVGILLGDVLVAEDLNAATSIWNSEGFFGKTIATLDGDVLDERGVITGGGAGNAEAGPLRNKSEMKRLRAELSSLEERINAAGGSLAGLNAELAATKAAVESAREGLHSTEIESVNLSSELKRHEEEAARLAASISRFDTELSEAAARAVDLSVKRSAVGAERDAVEAEAAGKEAEAAAYAGEIAVLKGEKERLSAAAVELKVELAHLKERHESLRKETVDKAALLDEAAARRAAREGEVESGRTEMAARRAEAVETKKRIEALLAKADETRALERARSEALSALQDRLTAGEAELRELKGALARMQETRGELTVEVKEMELTLRHLDERMTERYGVPLASIDAAESAAISAEEEEALNSKRREAAEKIEALGNVSLSALDEYRELEGRHSFLVDQQADLAKSVEALQSAITRINRTTREMFRSAFDEINARFQATFPRFFNGGRAELRLSEEGDVLESGIEIVAQPPGKKLQNIILLSGGEKALTATSLIFAIFLIKPSPFCLLDEVDAPLDDANIDRFNTFVKEMAAISQFILITHNKRTMEMADSLYGVTMEEPGVSKIISVKF